MPRSRLINKLTDVVTGEVSLVRAGANRKLFALTKREMDMDPIEAVLATEAEGEKEFVAKMEKKGLKDDALDAAVAQYRLSKAYKDKIDDDTHVEISKAAGYEAPKADPKPEPKPTEKSLDLSTLDADTRSTVEAIFKSHKDAVSKAEEMEKTLKSLRDESKRKDFIAKAEKEFDLCPGTSEEIGEMLQSAYEVSDDYGAKVEKQLKSTQEALKKSALLKTHGYGGNGGAEAPTSGGEAMQELQKMAEEHAKENNITSEKAFSEVLKTSRGRELYSLYKSEHPSNRR